MVSRADKGLRNPAAKVSPMRLLILSVALFLAPAQAWAGPVAQCPVPTDPRYVGTPIIDGLVIGGQRLNVYLSADASTTNGATILLSTHSSAYVLVHAGPDGLRASGRRTDSTGALPRVAEFHVDVGPGGATACVASPSNGAGYQLP